MGRNTHNTGPQKIFIDQMKQFGKLNINPLLNKDWYVYSAKNFGTQDTSGGQGDSNVSGDIASFQIWMNTLKATGDTKFVIDLEKTKKLFPAGTLRVIDTGGNEAPAFATDDATAVFGANEQLTFIAQKDVTKLGGTDNLFFFSPVELEEFKCPVADPRNVGYYAVGDSTDNWLAGTFNTVDNIMTFNGTSKMFSILDSKEYTNILMRDIIINELSPITRHVRKVYQYETNKQLIISFDELDNSFHLEIYEFDDTSYIAPIELMVIPIGENIADSFSYGALTMFTWNENYGYFYYEKVVDNKFIGKLISIDLKNKELSYIDLEEKLISSMQIDYEENIIFALSNDLYKAKEKKVLENFYNDYIGSDTETTTTTLFSLSQINYSNWDDFKSVFEKININNVKAKMIYDDNDIFEILKSFEILSEELIPGTIITKDVLIPDKTFTESRTSCSGCVYGSYAGHQDVYQTRSYNNFELSNNAKITLQLEITNTEIKLIQTLDNQFVAEGSWTTTGTGECTAGACSSLEKVEPNVSTVLNSEISISEVVIFPRKIENEAFDFEKRDRYLNFLENLKLEGTEKKLFFTSLIINNNVCFAGSKGNIIEFKNNKKLSEYKLINIKLSSNEAVSFTNMVKGINDYEIILMGNNKLLSNDTISQSSLKGAWLYKYNTISNKIINSLQLKKSDDEHFYTDLNKNISLIQTSDNPGNPIIYTQLYLNDTETNGNHIGAIRYQDFSVDDRKEEPDCPYRGKVINQPIYMISGKKPNMKQGDGSDGGFSYSTQRVDISKFKNSQGNFVEMMFFINKASQPVNVKKLKITYETFLKLQYTRFLGPNSETLSWELSDNEVNESWYPNLSYPLVNDTYIAWEEWQISTLRYHEALFEAYKKKGFDDIEDPSTIFGKDLYTIPNTTYLRWGNGNIFYNFTDEFKEVPLGMTVGSVDRTNPQYGYGLDATDLTFYEFNYTQPVVGRRWEFTNAYKKQDYFKVDNPATALSNFLYSPVVENEWIEDKTNRKTLIRDLIKGNAYWNGTTFDQKFFDNNGGSLTTVVKSDDFREWSNSNSADKSYLMAMPMSLDALRESMDLMDKDGQSIYSEFQYEEIKVISAPIFYDTISVPVPRTISRTLQEMYSNKEYCVSFNVPVDNAIEFEFDQPQVVNRITQWLIGGGKIRISFSDELDGECVDKDGILVPPIIIQSPNTSQKPNYTILEVIMAI